MRTNNVILTQICDTEFNHDNVFDGYHFREKLSNSDDIYITKYYQIMSYT